MALHSIDTTPIEAQLTVGIRGGESLANHLQFKSNFALLCHLFAQELRETITAEQLIKFINCGLNRCDSLLVFLRLPANRGQSFPGRDIYKVLIGDWRNLA